MRIKFCLYALLLCTLPSPSQTAADSSTGSVQGMVLDDNGKPLAGAVVYGLPSENMQEQIRTTADASGRFMLERLPVGDVHLHAYKEDDGYPDSTFAFYRTSEHEWMRVSVRSGKTIRDITIQLGVRAAHLNIALTNEDGSSLNDGAQLVFTRSDMPGPYRRGVSAKESLMVPAVPFRLTVEADGYEPWHYGGKEWQSIAGLITLKSGETLDLSVQLQQSRASDH